MKDFPSIEQNLRTAYPDISEEELLLRIDLFKHMLAIEALKNRTFRKAFVIKKN